MREAKSQSAETTFDTDVRDHAELAASLTSLAERLCTRLRSRELEGRTIGIKVRLDDWTTVTRAHTVEQPTNDPGIVTSVALDLLRAYNPPRPVRLLGVRLASFEREPTSEEDAPEAQLQLSLPGARRTDYLLESRTPTSGNPSRALVAAVRSKSRPAT